LLTVMRAAAAEVIQAAARTTRVPSHKAAMRLLRGQSFITPRLFAVGADIVRNRSTLHGSNHVSPQPLRNGGAARHRTDAKEWISGSLHFGIAVLRDRCTEPLRCGPLVATATPIGDHRCHTAGEHRSQDDHADGDEHPAGGGASSTHPAGGAPHGPDSRIPCRCRAWVFVSRPQAALEAPAPRLFVLKAAPRFVCWHTHRPKTPGG
jgi:hypothetical protein